MRISPFLVGLLLGVGGVPFLGEPAWGRAAPATVPIPQAVNLDITVPESVSIGSTTAGGTITGSLGTVVVEDHRGSLNPNLWTVTVSATVFVTGAGGSGRTIAASQVAYWSGPATRSTGGGILVPGQLTAAQAVTLGATRVAFRKTAGNGNNTVYWSPTLRVTVPAGVVAGTYYGTVTHSIA
ncbi:hypothetical protein GA0074692_5613 [Micromonospora pallida]|uniref:DUF4402 domain-containing protein n=1 Tax=Micromonospora pallida TaxID=145854 RepID=A0A1C6TEZ7_9ACTN|nr:hypothetical protein [Micromonospora pallida]SCL40132.1 hypothetical protein GA0074692_5613 [Micromonospora pallida]